MLAGKRIVRCGQAGVDAGQRAAIRLVAAAGGIVAAGIGERLHCGIGGGVFGRDREFGAERVHRVAIIAEDGFTRL